MLINQFATVKRMEEMLVHDDRVKIVMAGMGLVLLLGIIICLTLIVPLARSIDDGIELKTSLQQELKHLREEDESSKKMVANSSQLPEALGYLEQIFKSEAVSINEISLTQSADTASGDFAQTAVKITVNGDQDGILRALENTQTTSNMYLFIIQDINRSNNKTEINLELLLRKD